MKKKQREKGEKESKAQDRAEGKKGERAELGSKARPKKKRYAY